MGLKTLIKMLGKKKGIDRLPPENEWEFSKALQSALGFIVYDIRMDTADENPFVQLFDGVFAGYFSEVPCPQDTDSLTCYQKGLIIGCKARRSGLEEEPFKRILATNCLLREAYILQI